MIHTTPKGTRVEILVKDYQEMKKQIFYCEIRIDKDRGFIFRDTTEKLITFIEGLEKENTLADKLKFKK